jgi:integrase
MARTVPCGRGRSKVRWRDPVTGADRSTKALPNHEAEQLRRELDAEARARRELRTLRPGIVVPLATVLGSWARWTVANEQASEHHAAEVARILGRLIEARGWTTTRDVTTQAITAWRAEGGGTERKLGLLKTLLRYARAHLRQPVDEHVLHTAAKRVEHRPPPDLLTSDQVRALIGRARDRGGEHAGAIVEHLATYGCRPIDACRLRVRDFNPSTGMITLRRVKGGGGATHPLKPEHVQRYRALCANREPNAPLFLSPYGDGWRHARSAGQLVDWYTANVSEYLLPRPQRGLYALKDYAISTMDRAGIDDRTKALFTGHRTLAVFARYKTTNQERAAAAIAALARPGFAPGSAPAEPQPRPWGAAGSA